MVKKICRSYSDKDTDSVILSIGDSVGEDSLYIDLLDAEGSHTHSFKISIPIIWDALRNYLSISKSEKAPILRRHYEARIAGMLAIAIRRTIR
jgi:hypothetical protein